MKLSEYDEVTSGWGLILAKNQLCYIYLWRKPTRIGSLDNLAKNCIGNHLRSPEVTNRYVDFFKKR